jgi:hypothetical protein
VSVFAESSGWRRIHIELHKSIAALGLIIATFPAGLAAILS